MSTVMGEMKGKMEEMGGGEGRGVMRVMSSILETCQSSTYVYSDGGDGGEDGGDGWWGG